MARFDEPPSMEKLRSWIQNMSSVKNLHVREMYWDEIKLRPRKWNPRPRKRAEALAEADADRPIAEGPRKSIYSWRACCRGSSAEAESTYHSSAEAETVVAEAARKSARKTSRIRRELYRGFRHRSHEIKWHAVCLSRDGPPSILQELGFWYSHLWHP